VNPGNSCEISPRSDRPHRRGRGRPSGHLSVHQWLMLLLLMLFVLLLILLLEP
jgi:4-hydroxybenzoate polyprenyltransferase